MRGRFMDRDLAEHSVDAVFDRWARARAHCAPSVFKDGGEGGIASLNVFYWIIYVFMVGNSFINLKPLAKGSLSG